MPYLTKKICSHSRCSNAIERGKRYCSRHKKDDPQKDNKTHPWYNKSEWRGNPNKPIGRRGGLREQQLLEEPFCEHCQDEPAKDVDHKTAWKTGSTLEDKWELFTDPDNLQSLCKSCHRIKTREDELAVN